MNGVMKVVVSVELMNSLRGEMHRLERSELAKTSFANHLLITCIFQTYLNLVESLDLNIV